LQAAVTIRHSFFFSILLLLLYTPDDRRRRVRSHVPRSTGLASSLSPSLLRLSAISPYYNNKIFVRFGRRFSPYISIFFSPPTGAVCIARTLHVVYIYINCDINIIVVKGLLDHVFIWFSIASIGIHNSL